MRPSAFSIPALLAILLGAPLLVSGLSAQESGELVRGQTTHFRWESPASEVARTRPLTKSVEKELSAITEWLGLEGAPQGELIWVRNKQDLQDLLAFRAPSWFAAVTQPHQSRIIMVVDAAYSQDQLHKTLRHELVHWAMQSLGTRQWSALPAWAHEGVAELWAEQKLLGGMSVSLAWPAFRNELPYLGDYRDGFGSEPYRAAQGYALAHAFFQRLEREHGEGIVAGMMLGLRQGKTLDRTLIDLTGMGLVDHETALRDELGSLSRLLADIYPQFFLVVTLILLFGFPFAMRRRRRRQEVFERKWTAEDETLDAEDGGEDDRWLHLP